jgi:hypothetical protein
MMFVIAGFLSRHCGLDPQSSRKNTNGGMTKDPESSSG